MGSNNTRATSVRLPNEIAEHYSNRLRGIVESVYELEQEGKITVSEDQVEIPNAYKTSVPQFEECYTILRQIKSMTDFWGITLDGFLADVLILANEGKIVCQNGFLQIPTCPFDYKELENACSEKGVDIQEAVHKAAKMVWSSRI